MFSVLVDKHTGGTVLCSNSNFCIHKMPKRFVPQNGKQAVKVLYEHGRLKLISIVKKTAESKVIQTTAPKVASYTK